MRVCIANVGVLVLAVGGCAFSDELDRRIEQKVAELNTGVPEPKESQPTNTEPRPAPAAPVAAPAPVVPAPLGKPPGTPKITIKPASIVRGTLTVPQATRIIERHGNELRFCYEQSDAGDANVAITFVVSPTGSVQTAGIERADVNDEKLLVCFIQAFRRWTFPAPKDEQLAVVTVPIELSRVVAGGKR